MNGNEVLRKNQTWKSTAWFVLTGIFHNLCNTYRVKYFNRIQHNMSAAKEIAFPKVILFGDSITQVSELNYTVPVRLFIFFAIERNR